MFMRAQWLLVGLIFCELCHAGVWDRSADQRSKLPEAVAQGREKWGADLSLGYTHNTGNVEYLNAYGGLSLFNICEKNTYYLDSSGLYVKSGKNVAQNQRRATLRVDRPQTENFKWFAFNTHAYNEFLRLNYRTTVGAGPWYDFKGNGWTNGISFAPVSFHEEFSHAPVEGYMRASFRNNFMFKISDTAFAGFDLFYMPRANRIADHYDFFQPFVETKLYKESVALRLMYTVEFHSHPQPGVRKTDTEYLTVLTFKTGE
jgi:hypothetical protein